jgi:hypothetical protein
MTHSDSRARKKIHTKQSLENQSGQSARTPYRYRYKITPNATGHALFFLFQRFEKAYHYRYTVLNSYKGKLMRIDVFFSDRVGIAQEVLAELARRSFNVTAVEVDPPHLHRGAGAVDEPASTRCAST